MANWDRQYRFRATTEDGAGFTLGEPAADGRAVHISFSVKRTESTQTNSTTITFWNLTQAQISTLMTTGCTIEIMASYGSSMPVIFTGTMENVQEELDGADRKVTIEAADAFAETYETVVSVSYDEGVSAYKVLTDIAETLGTPVVYSSSALSTLQSGAFSGGYSYVGYAQGVLDDVCEETGLSWTIQNGILQVSADGEGVNTYIHVLRKETGLIRIPKRLYSSEVSSNETGTTEDALYGYEVEYLMNGAIGVGDTVYLESDIVTGKFLVSTLTITGDNLEGDWTCTADLAETS